MNLYGLLDAIINKVNRAVKVEKQELDSSLQKQARENINAPSKNEVCNPNLLDNWYFGNPVNQRGQISYSVVGYTIDRWTAAYGDISVSLDSDGLQLVSNGSNALIEQYLEEDLTGKTVCFSVLTDIGLFSETKVVDDLGYISSGVISNIGNLEIFVSGGRTIFRIWLKTEGASLKLIAAKLELGDTQTLAHQDSNGNWVLNEIPNYAEELLKCRQYDPYTGEHIGLRKFSQPRNLLDNSDFTNPVNQRGFSSGNSVGHGKYPIDRWFCYDHSGNGETLNIYLSNQGITFKSADAATITQLFPNISKYMGKAITLAIGLGDGTILAASDIVPTTEWIEFSKIETNNIYARIQTFNNDMGAVHIRAYTDITISWVALYEGEYTADTLPEYQPKGYAAELAECQRYFQIIPFNSNFNMPVAAGTRFSATAARIPLIFPQEFRIPPTMTIDSTIILNVANGGTAKSVETSGVTVSTSIKNKVVINVTSSDLVVGYPVVLYGAGAQGGGMQCIRFSADL